MDSHLLRLDFTNRAGIKTSGRLGIIWLLDCVARICLAIAFSLCAYLVFNQAAADHYSRQQTAGGIRRAIWWEPWNPEHYAELARALQRPLKEGDLPQVVSLYEKAVQLSPYDAAYWARLGQGYEGVGRLGEAQNAYERALLLSPNSSAMNWTVGNFYLREGMTEQAMRALQKTILGDSEMRRPAFDLAWRATGDGPLIAREMIPRQADIYFEYLDYLLETRRLDEAEMVWDHIVDHGFRFEPREAYPYLDALIQQRRIGQLTAAWSTLRKKNRSMSGEAALSANLVTNGDFETDILNGGLDWRTNPEAGAVIDIDNLAQLDGIHSLRIRFEGTQNLSDALIFQYVPVKPNASYRFSAYIRAQGITTDSGPRFQIRDADGPAKLFLQSDDLVGNSSWLRVQMDFKSGPDTHLLEIRVTRLPSAKFNNRIAGTAWVKQVALAAIESGAATVVASSEVHGAGP